MAGSARPTIRPHPSAALPVSADDAASPAPDSVAANTAQAETPDLAPRGLRALGATIAWLSGSLAGIGAIFYAFGYLITLANLHMLGLDLLAFHYEPTFYIQRGAGFLLLSAMDVGQFWFWLFVVLALGFLGGRALRRRGGGLIARQPFRGIAKHRDLWKALAYLALLLLLARQLREHLLFPEDLSVAGVLYPADGAAAAASPLRQWIVAGKTSLLQDRYAIFVNQQVFIGVLLLLAWGLSRGWRWGALLTAPFAVVFAISLAWLPLEYGKLALPNKFPQALVRVEHSAGPAGDPSRLMYLLNKTDSEFVLWDPQRHKIVWLPARTVASAEISASRSLSQIVDAPQETEKP